MKKFLSAVQLFLIAVIAAAAAVIAFYVYQSSASKVEIEEIRTRVESTPLPDSTEEPYAENGMLKKYFTLYTENKNICGWIKVDGTPIDYPVMQYSDNEFYMRHGFGGEYRYSGIPFMDFQCSLDPRSDNIIIYGHNMKDGTMFAGLSAYESSSFFKNHTTIKFDTLYSESVYKIAAVFYVKPDSFSYHTVIDFESDEEFDEFARQTKNLRLYDTSVELSRGDRLLTLSTCAYHTRDERLVIIAKMV